MGFAVIYLGNIIIGRGNLVPSKNIVRSVGTSLVFLLTLTNIAASAYESMIYSNLNRSRQALLDQRAHLQDSADRIGRQIDNLNRQLDTVHAYLRDTDSALRDVETSLNSMH
jgi:uncharacterized protein YlxW (UPF0749 family)